MTLKRMDNVLINVEDLEGAKTFFTELGMELVGETTVEGPWAGGVLGLDDVRADIAMMQTPDGQGRVELSKFHTPPAIRAEPENTPANALGIRRIMFTVEDIADVVARLRDHGAELVDEIAQYEDSYRLLHAWPRGHPRRLGRGARLSRGPAGRGRDGARGGATASPGLTEFPPPRDWPRPGLFASVGGQRLSA